MKRYSVVDGKLVELDGQATVVVRDASPGLGDVVAGAAKAVGVRPSKGCGCEKRRDALNLATPQIVRRMLDALRGYWSKW
jgi:pantoate kinase